LSIYDDTADLLFRSKTLHSTGVHMDPHELWMTAARAAAVYVLMLVVIRLLGKRTVGNFTAFDLLVALMLGEVVDELIYGDVTFAQGMVAIVVIAAMQYGNSWLSYYDHGFDAILEGRPTPVVQNGRLLRAGMRAERVSEREVMAELRVAGIDDLREVKLATIETEGVLSVIKEAWAQPLQKGDLRQEPPAAPPPRKKTTSKRNRG
jgi:uncharacterized membrane protein YcaP (DUF421 family)